MAPIVDLASIRRLRRIGKHACAHRRNRLTSPSLRQTDRNRRQGAFAADSDRDGAVTAGELIDFVSTDVAKLTGNKQHPRDFGNMDNATKLSDLSKPGIQLP